MVAPRISWSYRRMMRSFDAMFGWANSASNNSPIPRCAIEVGTGSLAARCGCWASASIRRCGRPSCRNLVSRCSTVSPLATTCNTESPVKDPISVASTPCRAQTATKLASCRGSIATTIRSWASDNHTSHAANPGYLSGTFATSIRAPTSSAISPTADDNPPAPQSVMLRYMPRVSAKASINNFSTMGSPICTLAPATSPVVAFIVIDENVAPRMPSRPVRPPRTTHRSPGSGRLGGCQLVATPMQPA